MSGAVVIKRGREKPVVNQHPWIFSGAIERVEGNPTPGDIVTVKAHDGRFLARGYWNPKSQIQVRNLTWQDEAIDEDWWRRVLKQAVMARMADQRKSRGDIAAFRIVNAENDYVPGLIVDKYDRWCVLQALTLGIDQRKHLLAHLLSEVFEDIFGDVPIDEFPFIRGVFERSDVDVRGKEGLKPVIGLLSGEEPPEHILIKETELLHFIVDVRKGHKTGFYVDQRLNRLLLLHFISDDFSILEERGHRVLNLFSYTGGFGVAALRGGHGLPGYVVNVDSSKDVLELAEENFKLNSQHHIMHVGKKSHQLDYTLHTEFVQADVFDYLRDAVERKETYDVIVCDPPKFAQSAQQVERAARGYKDLNLHCFKLVKPGGYLMTFSCSGAVSADLFQKIVFGALADSGRQAQILKHLGPGDDHPVALTFPEGAYLKGLLLRVY